MTQIWKGLSEPGPEYTPIPFWFFNDAFDGEKVREQLSDYVGKGVNGFVLHPRIGLPGELQYLSGRYFAAVRFIVETAASLGMKVALYDEAMYPSGSAHGLVVAANPEYASKGIALLEREEAEEKLAAEPSAQVIAELSGGRRIIYGFTGGTIRGIHFGEDDGEAGAPKSADILNPDAVEEFIRLTHDKYYENLKEYFGNTVFAFFTDEPCALGRNAGRYREWSKGLEQEILAAGGRPEDLEGLFTGPGEGQGRGDMLPTAENHTVVIYRRLIQKKLRDIFYARLSGWCEDHGVALMGHPEASDDVEEELFFHIPGQDLILRRVSPQTGGLREFDSVQAKLTADIARHLGRRRNANECFGVCGRDGIPWYFTPGDMKWYIDWLGHRGVNLFVPHAFYYSVSGQRKGERPPDVGPNNIWWKYYRRFSDYMKRLSWLMTDSVNGAKVAVLCDNNRVPCEEVACLYESQTEFNYLPAALLQETVPGRGVPDKPESGSGASDRQPTENVSPNVVRPDRQATENVSPDVVRPDRQATENVSPDVVWPDRQATENVSPDVVRPDSLATENVSPDREMPYEASVRDGKLCIAGYEYSVVLNVLGETYDGLVPAGVRIVHAGEELAKDKSFRSGLTLKEKCKTIRLNTLTKAGITMYLLGNEGDTLVRTDVSVDSDSGVILFDLWKGEAYSLGKTEFELCLDPGETVLILPADAAVRGQEGAFGEVPGCLAVQKPGESFGETAGQQPEIPLWETTGQQPGEPLWETAGQQSGALFREASGKISGDMPGQPLGNPSAEGDAGCGADIAMRAEMPAKVRGRFVDWTGRFTMAEKKANKAVYTYRCKASDLGEPAGFYVRGSEMVECYCNGQFVDVSFWGRHCFDLTGQLNGDDNEIRLVCTGSAANLYDNACVPFGLEQGDHAGGLPDGR